MCPADSHAVCPGISLGDAVGQGDVSPLSALWFACHTRGWIRHHCGSSAPSPAIRGVPLLGDSHVLPGSSSLEPHCVTAFPLVDGYGSPHINGLVRYGLVYLLGRLTRRRMAQVQARERSCDPAVFAPAASSTWNNLSRQLYFSKSHPSFKPILVSPGNNPDLHLNAFLPFLAPYCSS